MSVHIARIKGHSTHKTGLSLKTFEVMHQFATSQEMVVGAPICRRLLSYDFGTVGGDTTLQGGGDGRRHLVLHREDLSQGSVVSFCPKVAFGLSIDESSRYPDAGSDFANAPLHEIVDIEFSSHCGNIDRGIAKLKTRNCGRSPGASDSGTIR